MFGRWWWKTEECYSRISQTLEKQLPGVYKKGAVHKWRTGDVSFPLVFLPDCWVPGAFIDIFFDELPNYKNQQREYVGRYKMTLTDRECQKYESTNTMLTYYDMCNIVLLL